MAEKRASPDFDSFPQRELVFPLSRRELFSFLRTEFEVNEGETEGVPGYRLADLGSAPHEYLAHVIPLLVPGAVISVHDDWVWGQPAAAAKPIPLFPVQDNTTTTFNLMNGAHDLGSISLQLATQMAWPQERAFAFVRGLFLHLVHVRICAPR